MSNIGHNKPQISVQGLSVADKGKLKAAIQSMNDSMTRVAAEREHQKTVIADIFDEIAIDKKLFRRMAKVYFKANFNEEVDENKTFEDFYTAVIKVSES